MIGWILGAIGAGYICNRINENKAKQQHLQIENYQLRQQNNYLIVTIRNHRRLLADYDRINSFAKNNGFRGAVDFFFFLSERYDKRFASLARFLDKVRHIRNDVAHNGQMYEIDEGFLIKLSRCLEMCDYIKDNRLLPKLRQDGYIGYRR